MPIYPANQQLQQLLNQAVDPNRFSGIFDALLKLRMSEQGNQQDLFKTISQMNPQLASHIIEQPGVSEGLTKTPKLTKPTPDVLGPAMKSYQPAATSLGKPTTAANALATMKRWSESLKEATGLDMPEASVGRGAAIIAAGGTPSAKDLNIKPAHFEAMMAQSEQDPIPTVLFNRLTDDFVAKNNRLPSAEESATIWREQVNGRMPEEQQTKMWDFALQRLQKTVELMDKRMAALDQLNKGKPLTAKEITAYTRDAKTFASNARIMQSIKGLMQKVAAGDQKAFSQVFSQSAAIQGDDDLQESLMMLLMNVRTASPEQKGTASQLVLPVLDAGIEAMNNLAAGLDEYVKTGRQPVPADQQSTPTGAESDLDDAATDEDIADAIMDALRKGKDTLEEDDEEEE